MRDVTEFLAALGVDAAGARAAARASPTTTPVISRTRRACATRRARCWRAIPGLELVELAEADVCCGSAGSYNLTEPAMARRLRERKVDHIVATGATCVVAANPGCALQIRAGLARAGCDVRVAHPVELLDEGVSQP